MLFIEISVFFDEAPSAEELVVAIVALDHCVFIANRTPSRIRSEGNHEEMLRDAEG